MHKLLIDQLSLFCLLRGCTEAINPLILTANPLTGFYMTATLAINSKYQILNINRLHYIAPLLKSLKGLELLTSLQISTKNVFVMFIMIYTSF